MRVIAPDTRPAAATLALRAVAFVVCCFAAQKFILYGAKGYFVRAPQDFATYYLAARAFLFGVNPYDTERIWATFPQAADVMHPFLYPPASLLAVMGLTILTPRVAGLVFLAGSTALLAFALYRFARLFFDRDWAIVLTVAGFAFQPITSTFLIGQINAIVLACMALAIVFWRERRQTLAALFAAIGVALKLTPVFLLLFFLARREYRLAAKTAGWMAAIFVLSVAIFGWDLHVQYLGHFARTGVGAASGALNPGDPGWLAGQALAAYENQGLNGFLARLLVTTYVSEALVPRPELFDLVYRSIGIPLVLISALVAWRTPQPFVGLGIILCAALLVTPISWFHTFGTLYLIFIVLLKQAVSTRASWIVLFGLFCLVFFFHGGTSNLLSMLDPDNYRVGLRSLALSLPFFALAATWASLVAISTRPEPKELLA